MKHVTRLDKGSSLKAASKTPEGFLMFEGFATRAGVFTYMDQSGNVTRELRPPDEVGKPESLATLACKPVTDNHPNAPVDAENISKFGVGSLSEEVDWVSNFENGFVRVRGIIQRADAVRNVMGGKQELSCGYTCDVDETPGEWTDSTGTVHKYDAIQKNIIYNHLAIVEKGRAGDKARIRVDAAMIESKSEKQKTRSTKMIRIDGQDFDESEVSAINRAIAELEKKRNDARESATKLEAATAEIKAKADAAEAEVVKAKAEGEAVKAELNQAKAELDVIKASKKNDESEADRLAWFNERLELVKRADALGVTADDAATNGDLKRAIVLAKFDAADVPTQTHVDVAFNMLCKEKVAPVNAPMPVKKNDSAILSALDEYNNRFKR